MTELPVGGIGTFDLVVGPEHTAAALGNNGMQVLGTPFVVWMIEVAAYRAMRPALAADEGIAGTAVNIRHLAPVAVGHTATATVQLTGESGRRRQFTARVESAGHLIAEGTYESAVVNLERMLGRAAGGRET
jgi:predicted thioesterase